MKGYRIQIVRHGITDANIDGRYIGTTDYPLNSKGVNELYQKLEDFEYPTVQKVYSSPLLRCTQTVDILYPNRYTQLVPELREIDFGEFEDKLAEELMGQKDYKDWLQGGVDNAPPKGESIRDIVSRSFDGISYVIQNMMDEGLTNCAIVTHGGIIMNTLACFGIPKAGPHEFNCDFGEGFEILVTAQMWQNSKAFEILGRFPYTIE